MYLAGNFGFWSRSRNHLEDKKASTRPFRYDQNQTPYDYTVEVKNRFKGLDLIDRVPDELWTEIYDIVQETGIKTIPMEKKCKKSKMAVWGGVQVSIVKAMVFAVVIYGCES